MSVLTESDRRDHVTEADPTPREDRGRPPRWRSALGALLALVVASGVASIIWMSLADRASADGGLDLPDEREQVMSLTDQFVKRLGTYSPDMLDDSGRMPSYRTQVREVITPKFAADFDEQVATAEQLVAQGSITRTADVFATAVSSIDDDSARVLVAGAFTDRYEQGSGDEARTIDQEPLPFRFTVDLVMIEGDWLVDDFTPVSSPDDEAGTGTSQDDLTEGSAP